MPHRLNPSRILITRRDHIGDMLCTTPLLEALRIRYPAAHIAILVTDYNVDAIRNNPNVDEIFVYIKRRKNAHLHGYFSLLRERLKLLRSIRRQRFDLIILANGGYRYARQLGGKKTLGFKEVGRNYGQPDWVVPCPPHVRHEVEKLNLLGQALGAPGALGALDLIPDAPTVSDIRTKLTAMGWDANRPTIAIHISSRRPQQRWPIERFAEFLTSLHQQQPALQFMLLWSPGPSNSPMHPGDDENALALQKLVPTVPLILMRTQRVGELIAACSLCDQFVGSDGGAMHVAAALHKPILCFFGDSHKEEWHPWGVPYVLLQPESQRTSDISVEETLAGFTQLQALISQQ